MKDNIHAEKILILDFGSQYTQLIARRIRENKVYCEIHPFNLSLAAIRAFQPKGIILSGGPSSVYDKGAPLSTPEIYNLGVPVLGICYGMQLMAHQFGGKVAHAIKREYGHADLFLDDVRDLFYGLEPGPQKTQPVWMSHGDKVNRLPAGFTPVAHTAHSPIAALRHKERPLFGVQFHPEVVHTSIGNHILKNFIRRICKIKPRWTMKSFIETTVEGIKEKVGSDRAICGLSGGVDSSVVAVLMHKAIGRQLTCIFVNNGMLRRSEPESVRNLFMRHYKIKLAYVDASGYFLKQLKGVVDPEAKRRIIGHGFIHIFEKEARRIGKVKYLAQGTLYPDVIESVSFKGPSAIIKTHHNVGGLPEIMKLELIEPLRELFKDEVRKVGLELGMPKDIVYRQPFPGPGLAIRILGEVTAERLAILQEADAIVLGEMKKAGLYRKVWQSFAVLLPIKTVGVMGDQRTYEHVIALRVVDSLDAMTADWSKIPYNLLSTISNRIINEVKGINRVVYDISSKPPSTIEWE